LKRLIIISTIILILFSKNQVIFGDDLYLSGTSYILMDELSGRVLVEKNSHQKMPMASTTKIMTALLALEKGNLDDNVLIDDDSVNIEGSSIYLEKNEVINLKDLLYGLMLRSGNDAAMAIGKYIGGTVDNFVTMMNIKAKSINALNTNFKNPHGLDDLEHYSTAYDLALITREALKNKDFKEIFRTKSYIANRDRNNYFVNKNKTLWEYEGGDGGKTGYTMKTGRCLVSTSSRNGFRLIAVSLNAPDWFNDNYKLLDYGFENFKHYLVYDKNQFITKTSVVNGKDDVELVTKKDLIYPLTKDEKESIKINISLKKDIYAPIQKGQILGTIETYLDGKLIKKDNLIAKKDVKKQNLIDKIFKS